MAKGRVAVTLFNGLGDGLIARPLLAALSQQSQVDLYCFAGQEEDVFGGLDLSVYPRSPSDWDKPPQGPAPARWVSLNAYSPAPDETPFHMAWPSTPRRGFDCNLVHKSGLDWRRLPMRDQFFLVAGVDRSCLLSESPPWVSPDAARQASTWSASAPDQPLCMVHADTLQDKMWAAESWQAVTDHVVRAGFQVVACGQDVGFWRATPQVKPAWPDLGLAAQFALLRRADVFIGVDSVFLHAADAFQVPGIALIGPTDAMVWAPGGGLLRVVGGKSQPMHSIRPDDVLAAVYAVIDKHARIQ